MGEFEFGAKSVGRLMYRTEEEAGAAADELGLDGVHAHRTDHDSDGQAERVAMPGENHSGLNAALESRGLEPTDMPGKKSDDMGKRFGDDMLDSDMAMLDGMGMGGEFGAAGRDTLDVDMAMLDGMGMGGELSGSQMEAEMQVERAMEDGMEPFGRVSGAIDIGESDNVAGDALTGVFVGDEDDDGLMELY
jgi:hypothetical protein